MRVLDAGCGVGGFSAALRDANDVIGADINEECLRYLAAKGWPTILFDLEALWPLAPRSFDLVLLGDVLEHLFAISHVISEARRVVKPDGRILVAVPNAGYWRRRLRLLLQGDLGSDLSDHIRYFSPKSLARVCRSAGLTVDGMRPYSWNSKLDAALPLDIAWGFVARLAV